MCRNVAYNCELYNRSTTNRNDGVSALVVEVEQSVVECAVFVCLARPG